MLKHYRKYFIIVAAFLLLLGGGSTFAWAKSSQQQATPTISSKSATSQAVVVRTVNMANVATESPTTSTNQKPKVIPLQTGVSANVYAQRKGAAKHTKTGTTSTTYAVPTLGPNTPGVSTKFKAMSDSTSICPPFGCQPPDMALAASSSWVLQGVNASFAVYNTTGTIQAGWPKAARSFFGVPDPGSCDTNGAFLSDPRAFYDPNDQRFWVAMLQVQGAFGIDSCPFKTLYWIAVSQTNNPNGAWNIYAFDMSLGTTNAADYTQFGFDQQAIYFSGNMFNQAGTAYEYAEIFGVTKSTMESGSAATAYGFFSLSATSSTTILVDTVQPVEAQAATYSGPRGGLFINSFNINGDPFGHDCFSTACTGVVVWSMAKPGTSSTSLTGTVVSTPGYILAPNADEPGCSACIETLDTRISGTPIYHDGFISFALEEGLNNGTQVVPCVSWGQVTPILSDAAAVTSAPLYQHGDYCFSGDSAASFGALMPDAAGDLYMVYEFMSNTINPSVAYTARRVSFTLGQFHDGGLYLRKGDAATTNSRWGDYEAASYEGSSSDNVWFAGEYSNSTGDWSTYIGKDRFCSSCG
jgi:hypothetical protein